MHAYRNNAVITITETYIIISYLWFSQNLRAKQLHLTFNFQNIQLF